MKLIVILILVIGIPMLIVYYVFVINIAQRFYDRYESKRRAEQIKTAAKLWDNLNFDLQNKVNRMSERINGKNHKE